MKPEISLLDLIVEKALAMRWIVTEQVENARFRLPLECHRLVQPSKDVLTLIQFSSVEATGFKTRYERVDLLQVGPYSDVTCSGLIF